MKAKINVLSANSDKVKKFMETAASAGSDNGLSANYLTVVLPIIEEKTIRTNGVTFGAFMTMLFNPENLEFVKFGSVSIAGVQRTANLCESENLPDGCTLDMVRAMPQIEIIAGSSRTNGKSAYETVKGWFDNKQVLRALEQKNVVSLQFENGQPTINGATVRKRWTFEPKVKEEIFAKIGEIMKESFEPSQDENLKSHFAAANMDLPFTR